MAAKQKDLVQRLESTLIHWTRQIKEVLNRQDDRGHPYPYPYPYPPTPTPTSTYPYPYTNP